MFAIRARCICFVRSVFGDAGRPVERSRFVLYQRPKASKSLYPRAIGGFSSLDLVVKYRGVMPRVLTVRGQERRRQVMDMAVRMFATEGYHATSISRIVAGLGVGKGVFYW